MHQIRKPGQLAQCLDILESWAPQVKFWSRPCCCLCSVLFRTEEEQVSADEKRPQCLLRFSKHNWTVAWSATTVFHNSDVISHETEADGESSKLFCPSVPSLVWMWVFFSKLPQRFCENNSHLTSLEKTEEKKAWRDVSVSVPAHWILGGFYDGNRNSCKMTMSISSFCISLCQWLKVCQLDKSNTLRYLKQKNWK